MANKFIILLHGGASSGRMYKDVIPLLESNGYTVIASDLPGHGSSAADGSFTFERAQTVISMTIERLTSNSTDSTTKVMLVGISLGAQAVLYFLQSDSKALGSLTSAIVSGASIHPPDEAAQWEMPRMENMPNLQNFSFGFTFDLSQGKTIPPTLAVVGEFDTSMSRRDLSELTGKLKKGNSKCESLVMAGAWHNHSIDVPENFTQVIMDWAEQTL